MYSKTLQQFLCSQTDVQLNFHGSGVMASRGHPRLFFLAWAWDWRTCRRLLTARLRLQTPVGATPSSDSVQKLRSIVSFSHHESECLCPPLILVKSLCQRRYQVLVTGSLSCTLNCRMARWAQNLSHVLQQQNRTNRCHRCA